MLTYRNVSIAGTVATVLVFVAYAFIPAIANFLFGIAGSEESNFVLRRCGFLLLGIGVITWMSRNEGPSVARNAISCGIGVALLCVAMTGVYDFSRGFAGPGIWLLTGVEILFGVLFLNFSREKISSNQPS